MYKAVEASSAYKHGRYKRIGWKTLHIMFNMRVFAMFKGQTDRQTNTLDHIDLCVTHMDQESCLSVPCTIRKQQSGVYHLYM